MNTPAAPLQLAHDFDCGPVHVEVLYVPTTDVAHITGETSGDPFRDRFEIRLGDRGMQVGEPFDYATPQPLQFFFSVLRKQKDGSLVDVTTSQIDPRHTGSPRTREMSFTRAGETLTDQISYFALATILSNRDIVAGDYVVRLRSFDVITARGTTYPSDAVDMPITVRSVRNP